jgi:hypothetical protein
MIQVNRCACESLLKRCPIAGPASFAPIPTTIMTETTENLEHAEHAHASGNKKLALLIAILALVLAITETLSKSYQTEVILKHQEAANLWSFFQAKSVRGNAAQLAKQQLTCWAIPRMNASARPWPSSTTPSPITTATRRAAKARRLSHKARSRA